MFLPEFCHIMSRISFAVMEMPAPELLIWSTYMQASNQEKPLHGNGRGRRARVLTKIATISQGVQRRPTNPRHAI
jgi:hypothetical protein